MATAEVGAGAGAGAEVQTIEGEVRARTVANDVELIE